ncbi:peptide ABC transporter permease [Mergibacter septicus]|uniref:ABC transporter permease subunit n=1 Tax=Mergibacter septicus TaxID=221402 RepID=UPI0011795A11|nr:ABC transporter permease subunit [Mergibacter septicus]AWX13112.1 peptide ABC transporter permease [Mergibacter septicus]
MLDKDIEDFRLVSPQQKIWQHFRQDKLAVISLILFLALCFIALFSPLLSPYGNNMQFVGNELIPPAWTKTGRVAFFLGTDDIGRDLFSRIILGTRYTFGSALAIVVPTLLIGCSLGCIIGINQGRKSRILGNFFDLFLSIPILLIAIIIAALMESSLQSAMLAILLALLPHFVHQVYSAVKVELQKDYVVLLQLEGISKWALLKETILPNIMSTIIRETTRAFTLALMDISALSFISLGASKTMPEWGMMIHDSLDLLYIAPWAVILPGVAIILSIIIITLFSNSLLRAITKAYA